MLTEKTKTKMKNKTIILEGVEYSLVPVEKTEVNENSVTFYYACASDCGFFTFHILLDDQGEIWEDTQSITYYPDGQTNKNNSEYWDNSDFLREVLRDEKINEYSDMPQITQHHEKNLVNLLKRVHEKGWI